MATLHFAAGGTATEVATAGFNLVDVQTVEQLNALPEGSKGLVWLNESSGVTSSFIDKVTPFIGNPKVFGFFLADEPDPTGKYHTYVSAADLMAESDWIHSHLPGAKSFITLMEMGGSATPDFSNTYNYANTHIDLFGIDPYPVRTGTSSVDYNMIDKTVAAAVASGIPVSQIVPVYQTFGGGNWTTDTGGKYVMPTTAQLQTMMDHWSALVPSPAFDFAYAWGSQEGDTALENSPELQAFFLQHNLQSTGATPPVSDPADATATPPVSDPVAPTTPTVSDQVSAPATPTVSDPASTPAKLPASDHVFHGTHGKDLFHPTTGNDTYYADNARDKVVEAPHGGTDKVLASVSYTLSAGSEMELLATTNPSGTTPIKLTGNGYGQTIHGNAGANIIDGRGGADKMFGHGGNDTYYVDNAGDKAIEAVGGGTDKVLTSVSYALSAGSEMEHLAPTKDSKTPAINLTGNAFAQTIQGNAGANVINGGGGDDILTGGKGKDVFVFNADLGAGNVDRITDFNKAQDKIHLDHDIFAGLQLGGLSSKDFFAGTAAHENSDHIIYDSSTGALSFDSDGIGGAHQIQFATVSPHLSLTASSFFVT